MPPPGATQAQAGPRAHPPGAIDATPVATTPIPDASRQLIIGLSDSWSGEEVELHRFKRREAGGEWASVASPQPWRAAIGHAGLGWGVGLHGDLATRADGDPIKVEGDGRSPAGVFAIGAAFGYDARAPEGSRSSYTALDKTWRCVDDPESTQYNRVFSESGVDKDWKSAERMRRSDALYRWVVLVDHNHIAAGPREDGGEPPRAGAGSCIFFHVWRDVGSPTVGCAAMDRGHLEELITWLDPSDRPVVVFLPRAHYEARRGEWSLPAIR